MYKHLSLFVAVLAAFALAACSDNDSLDDSAATSDTEVSTSYMAVNIYMTADAATRSSVSGGTYESGDESEYAIDFDNSIFLFYDSEGKYLTSGTLALIGEASTTGSGDTDYAEWSGTALIAITTSETPKYVVGIFNDAQAQATTNNPYQGKSLSALQEALFSSSNELEATSTNAGILMSNAVMYDSESTDEDESSKFSFATSISSENLVNDQSTALANPVEMYVERAKAKVAIGISSSSGWTTNSDAGTYTYTLKDDGSDRTFVYYYVDEDGTLTSTDGATVDITINGWAVNAYNTTGYVIKNYSNDGTELDDDISANRSTDDDGNTTGALGGAWGSDWYSNYRIFWAVDGNYSYSDDDDEESTDDTTWDLTYLSWNGVTTQTTPCSTSGAYYYEQTLDPNATTGYNTGETAYAPTLLVAATIGVTSSATESSDNSDDAGDYFLVQGTYLFSKQAMYAKVLALLKEAGYSGSATISKITWATVDNDEGKGYVTIESITMSDNSTTYSSTDTGNSYVETINKAFFYTYTLDSEGNAVPSKYLVVQYSGGACYYQVPIQTYISTTTDSHPYGLVRNTSYSITINSITGIGGGVPNTEEKLTEIPGEDGETYCSIKVNILAWRLSSQTVDL